MKYKIVNKSEWLGLKNVWDIFIKQAVEFEKEQKRVTDAIRRERKIIVTLFLGKEKIKKLYTCLDCDRTAKTKIDIEHKKTCQLRFITDYINRRK